MENVYTDYQLFQKNEFIQKLVDAGAKYYESCVDRDVMPTITELAQFNDEDMNLITKKEWDKLSAMEIEADERMF